MNVRAQIRFWLSLNQSNYDKLAQRMTNILKKKYTRGSINAKLSRGTLTVKEFETIAEIYNYKLEVKEK
ncbi:hypothetical protein IJ674_07370 [bacterium]|jgi:hypothetical protein|nr:hypothetical protein [bacterium]